MNLLLPVSLSLLDCNSNDSDPCVLKSHDDDLNNCITEIRDTSIADGGKLGDATFSSNNSGHEESHTYNQTRFIQHNDQQHKSKGSTSLNSVLKLPATFKNSAGDSKVSKTISMKSHDDAQNNYSTEIRDISPNDGGKMGDANSSHISSVHEESHTADFTNLTGERNVAKAIDRKHQGTVCCDNLLLTSFPRESDMSYNNLTGIRRKQDDATSKSKSSNCFQAELHTDNSHFCADKRDCAVALETMSLDKINSSNLNNTDLNKVVSCNRQSRLNDLNLAVTMVTRDDFFAHGEDGLTHDVREARSSELVSRNRLANEGSNNLNSNQLEKNKRQSQDDLSKHEEQDLKDYQNYGSPDSYAMEASNPTRRSLITRDKEQKEDLVRIRADCRKLFDPG